MTIEKFCSKCKNTLPSAEFYNTKKGLAPYCKTCSKSLSRQYHENNKEKAKASLRASYHKNKEAREAYRAKYRADPAKQAIEKASKKLYGEANREKINEYNAYYRSTQAGRKIRLHHQNLRTERIERATPPWADLEAIKEFYKNCPEGCEVDHIIPLQGKNVCGLHILENLQYLSITENRRKSNKYEGLLWLD